MSNKKYAGINCSKCGRWVGKGGYLGAQFDDDSGLMELWYPLCRKCREEQFKDE